MTQASNNFSCPKGTKPCSADPNKPGFTFCTETSGECPVTFLAIYTKATLPDDVDWFNYDKYDVYWISNEIFDKLGDDEPILVWSRTEGLTNSPLQSVLWSAGHPCAYGDQWPVYDKGLKNLRTDETGVSNICQGLKLYDNDGESTVIDPAIDDRYKLSSEYTA